MRAIYQTPLAARRICCLVAPFSLVPAWYSFRCAVPLTLLCDLVLGCGACYCCAMRPRARSLVWFAPSGHSSVLLALNALRHVGQFGDCWRRPAFKSSDSRSCRVTRLAEVCWARLCLIASNCSRRACRATIKRGPIRRGILSCRSSIALKKNGRWISVVP